MSNADYGLTAEALLESLPAVLREDDRMRALAAGIADLLASRVDEISGITIYPSIDTLPEELLDILARDFKVDWYGYDYPIEAKRDLLKNSFRVHRRLGTKAALVDALSAVYPGAAAVEWFEYDGDPYHFRVVLDMTDPRVELSKADLLRIIDIYKSLRSVLDDDTVVIRARSTIQIRTSSDCAHYDVRRCGTYPIQSLTLVQGGISNA